MEKTFNPQAIEQKIYESWEKSGYFKPGSNKAAPLNPQIKGLRSQDEMQGGSERTTGVYSNIHEDCERTANDAARLNPQPDPSYCIVIPPPNVTGTLHMGHGFQYALMDTLIRYHRMSGATTLWQVGTDHAGIATQMVVEQQLQAEGADRKTLGREKFTKRIWEWKEKSGGIITEQMRRMGISVDWSRERFTLDAGLTDAVLTAFEKLYDEGLIYRGNRLVNWDPKLQTAVSDLEVVNEETAGFIWHLKYPLADDPEKYLIVATTRPETMLGDTAVAVHPDDERYRSLIGKHIKLPFADREIPIIADTYVDPSFGSGCVKITPAHDFNDYAVGQRHKLPMINIFNLDATLNDQVPFDYRGLERFAARKKLIADFEAAGLLEKIVPHTLQIPRNDRGSEILEPMLMEQWYVKATALAPAAIDAVKTGRTRFVPENWENTYFQWLENIQDWCISRQLWWGHRVPAWYDDAGKVYVAKSEAAVREKYKLSSDFRLRQEEDVLDTWFSAALWPFATLGWPDKTADLTQYYPSNVLVTGFDIIFFWVARMMMFGLHFMGDVPFKEVYVTGLIRDEHGQKMSKSKGNVLDPIDLVDGISLPALIEKRCYGLMQPKMRERIIKTTEKQFPNGIAAHGTDALRFMYCALATTGRDIKFDLLRLEGYRNFANKIWNAARFVLMNVETADFTEPFELNLADRWILSQLQETIKEVHKQFQQYRFDLACQALYDFIWNQYCDWYLELSKPILNGEDVLHKRGNQHTLLTVLEILLRLIHPIMPFISTAIWPQVKDKLSIQGETLMLQPYPQIDKSLTDLDATAKITWLQTIILGVRNIRGEMNLAPGKLLTLYLARGEANDAAYLAELRPLLMQLAKLSELHWLNKDDPRPASATALAGNLELLIPLAGLIDLDAEKQRLLKEIQKLRQEQERSSQKLANPAYADKAPPEVVAKEKEKLALVEAAMLKLETQLSSLSDNLG